MRLIITLVLFWNFIYADALYNRGEYLYFAKACSSCHGPSAEGSSSAPKLANRSSEYLFSKLSGFKNGKFYNQSQEMMFQFVRTLNKKDLEAISKFLSEHKVKETSDVNEDLLGGFGS